MTKNSPNITIENTIKSGSGRDTRAIACGKVTVCPHVKRISTLPEGTHVVVRITPEALRQPASGSTTARPPIVSDAGQRGVAMDTKRGRSVVSVYVITLPDPLSYAGGGSVRSKEGNAQL